jgi:hypothetical protein
MWVICALMYTNDAEEIKNLARQYRKLLYEQCDCTRNKMEGSAVDIWLQTKVLDKVEITRRIWAVYGSCMCWMFVPCNSMEQGCSWEAYNL